MTNHLITLPHTPLILFEKGDRRRWQQLPFRLSFVDMGWRLVGYHLGLDDIDA
ncbi:MAG: hypothetical protein PVH03_00085 [Chloroflexota bacterium]|jgi:hypothetical protein